MYGHYFTLWWTIPFLGIVFSIALCPLISSKIWHKHYGKISLFWILMLAIPLIKYLHFTIAIQEIIQIIITEYLPFIILLFALFVISSGIYIHGSFTGTPMVNTIFLLVGSLLSSLMGTTGTSMLLIRPVLRANKERKHKVHIVIFFIFLVANIGGSLSPVGDPPLFIGFLNGVPFLWPLKNLIVPFILTVFILLILFFIIDTYYFRHEKIETKPHRPLGIEGKKNIIFLLALSGIILISGMWHSNSFWNISPGIKISQTVLIRNIILLLLAGFSWFNTSPAIHKKNHFSWEPILEIAQLFLAIFITIAPVLSILHAGKSGALHTLINLLNHNDIPNNNHYFWITGILSAFLDNAPTYLVFFNATGYNAQHLITYFPETLRAISVGSVFMGAITYIGNAPNFMIRSIAQSQKITMPSFFGYLLWSFSILFPVFLLIGWIFF